MRGGRGKEGEGKAREVVGCGQRAAANGARDSVGQRATADGARDRVSQREEERERDGRGRWWLSEG